METKLPFYKRKMLVIPMVALMAIAMIAAAVVLSQHVAVNVTVDEGLTVMTTAITVPADTIYAGDTVNDVVTIRNVASVPLYVTLTWEETLPIGVVTYTEGQALDGTVQTVAPGADTSLPVSWAIDEDSPVGAFIGTVTITRVAAP